jgi:HK97 family phage portal protein
VARALEYPNPAQSAFLQSYKDGGIERMLPEFRSYAEQGYKGNGIVFSVILARLMLFSEAEFKFRDLETKRLYGTTALDILENPWPGGTTGELLARMEQDVSLGGNAFIRRAGDRLERMRPDRVAFILGETQDGLLEVAGYEYDRDGVGFGSLNEIYPADEVAHWSPIPDPLAEYRGMSWLTPVVREINSDQAMTQHKVNFFENAATPNLLIKYQRKLTADQVAMIGDRWNAKYGGPEGSWRTAVLDEGADVTPIGHSFEQMAFTGVQAAGENRIAAAAGVPGIVVGLKEGLAAATYSNYEQAMRRFADVTMRPLWRSAAAALAKLVDVPEGSRLWYDTTDIAALRQGEKDRAETAQIMSLAAGELIRSGYDPATVGPALTAGDFALLKHSGAIPTALYPNGQDPAGARDLTVPETVQKVYLGVVNDVISADEARKMINDAGGKLTGPAPTAKQPTPQGGTP